MRRLLRTPHLRTPRPLKLWPRLRLRKLRLPRHQRPMHQPPMHQPPKHQLPKHQPRCRNTCRARAGRSLASRRPFRRAPPASRSQPPTSPPRSAQARRRDRDGDATAAQPAAKVKDPAKGPASIAAAATATAISENPARPAPKARRVRASRTQSPKASVKSAASAASVSKARARCATAATSRGIAAPWRDRDKGGRRAATRPVRPGASPICVERQSARPRRRRSEFAVRKARGAEGTTRAERLASRFQAKWIAVRAKKTRQTNNQRQPRAKFGAAASR